MSTLRYRLLPAGYALLTYGTVRLLTDLNRGYAGFWHRPWLLNVAEVAFVVLLGYGLIGSCRALLRAFDRRWPLALGSPHLGREVAILAGVTLVICNAALLPWAALTDDGLSRADVALINTVPLLYMLIYYSVVRSRHFLAAYLDRELHVERLTLEQARTELQFLRAQYHPHFLFNALNTVYFQMDEDVAAAKRSLEQVAALLRYQLYDQQQPVAVRQELDYLRDYIALQQVRRSDPLQLTVDFDPQLAEQRLYPLLLLPLLENAFKYLGGAGELAVRAGLAPNGFWFRVRNSVAPVAPSPSLGGSGLGLHNLRRRLALLYPQRHQLHTECQADYFEAQLLLTLS